MKRAYTKAQRFSAIHQHPLMALVLGLGITLQILISPAFGAASIDPEMSFTPADPVRNWMDVGGVWDGSADVSFTRGDTFTLVLDNSASGDTDVAHDLVISVNLPNGFLYVANTVNVVASGAGCGATVPTIGASQTGNDLNFSVGPGSYDLPAQCQLSIDFGLRTDTTLGNSSPLLQADWQYALGEGASLEAVQSVQLAVLVQAGAALLTKTPGNQLRARNSSAEWTVQVINTGLGGLFDVDIDETAINPGNSLALGDITVTGPLSPVATTPAAGIRRIAYLAPGETYGADVDAIVTGCDGINNVVATSDRTLATATTTNAQVSLDLKQPLVSFSVPNVSVPYGGTTPVSFDIHNTGLGEALNLVLDSNLESAGVTVSNISAGWSFDGGSGRFTYTGGSPAGTLAAGSVTLSFDIEASNTCSFSGMSLKWEAGYTDVCANPYGLPILLSSIGAATDEPAVLLTKSVAKSRTVVGEASNFTLNFSASNTSNIAGSDFSIIDVLPAGMTGVSLTPSAGSLVCSGSGTCIAGETVTWTVPRSEPSTTATLSIGFNAPADTCLGGSNFSNSASVDATSTASCPLSSLASATTLLTNNPDATLTQLFEVADPGDGSYETGSGDDNTNNIQDVGEGEFIPFTASYSFGAAYPGTWSGTLYSDNFGNLPGGGLQLISSTLEISLNSAAGVPIPDPASNVTCTSGAVTTNDCAGGISIDLGFLAGAGYFNNPDVDGQSIEIRYSATATDATLPAVSSNSRDVTQLVTLQINGGGAGGCGDISPTSPTYTQGAFYTLARGAPALDLSMPGTIDVCEVFPVTMTVSNQTASLPSNLLATLSTAGDYAYPTGQAPVYGGLFNAGNITYNENGGTDPNFALAPSATELSVNGTISFSMQHKAGPGMSSFSPTALSASADYDDNETSIPAGRAFSDVAGSASPALVNTANISLTVTPQDFTVSGSTASWVAYVTNGGAGTAYGAELVDTLPSAGLAPNAAATNAANVALSCAPEPDCDVSVAGQEMSWTLGDIPAGETRIINIVTDISGATCSIPTDTNSIVARWGCGGIFQQSRASNSPNFTFPSGELQVLHDTTSTSCPLCGTGTDIIIIRNTGATHVEDVLVSEVLNPVTTGLDIVPGSVDVSTDGGSSWTPLGAGANPTGSGTTGDPYQWSKTEVAVLADLAPLGEAGGINEVRIRFSITSSEAANAAPVILASASGTIACGQAVNSPGTAYSIPITRPDFIVTKQALNRTVTGGAAGSGSYSDTIFGGSGDVIEWKVSINNNGNQEALNVRLADVFPGSLGTAVVVAPSPSALGAINNDTAVSIIDIPANSTHVYYIQETLGANCVNGDNSADVTWGCVSNGPNARSNLTAPTTNSATATLNMIPDFSSTTVEQTMTSLPGGRAEVQLRLTNEGGKAQNMVVTDTLSSGMVIDTKFTPTLTNTATTTADNLTGMLVNSTTPGQPVFTLNGAMRHGLVADITFRIIQSANFDTTADADVVDETAPGSDPVLPADFDNLVDLVAESSCGVNVVTPQQSSSIDPLTPDVDLTVSPASQTLQSDFGFSLVYDYVLTNNGDAASVADHLEFTLLTIGAGWDTVSSSVLQAGNGGSSGDACPANVCDSALLGTLDAGQLAIVRVVAVTSTVPSDLDLLGQVEGSLFADDGTTDTTDDYSLDQAQPVIVDDVVVSGFLYRDADADGSRDGGETGPGIGGLYAKLIEVSGTGCSGPLAVAVDGGSGAYSFSDIADCVYDIIIDDNNVTTDTTAVSLSGWIAIEGDGLTRRITVSGTDVQNRNFGVFNGSRLSGRVFQDTGEGIGTANDGVLNGSEAGLQGISVIAVNGNCAGGECDRTLTQADGSYLLWIPAAAVGAVTIDVTDGNGFFSIGAEVGTTAGIYDSGSDSIAFTAVDGTSYSGVNFADVPVNRLDSDGALTLLPGTTGFYPHSFIAGSDGELTLSTMAIADPVLAGWSEVIIEDSDCDGQFDGGEPQISAAVMMNAGDQLCILVKQFVPANAPFNAKNQITLGASFNYENAVPPIVRVLTRRDISTVGEQSNAGLKLVKSVNATTALPGETLVYTIVYSNESSGPLSAIVVHDSVPAFTDTAAACCVNPGSACLGSASEPFPDSITGCTASISGNSINWTMVGTLAPEANGTVKFSVVVQ